MIARFFIVFAFLLNVANLGSVLRIERFSIVERLAFLVAAIVFVISRRKDFPAIFLFLFVLIYTAAAGFFTIFPGFSWAIYVLSINQFSIIYLFLAAYPTSQDRRTYFLLVATLPLISVALGYAYELLQLKPLFAVEFATNNRRLAGSLIPAFLSAYAMCGMFASTRMAVAERKPLYMALFAANFLVILLAGGRAPMAVGLAMCAMILLADRDLRSDYKLVSVVVGMLALSATLLTIGQTVLSRFSDSGLNGRDVIWKYTLELADRYPWTGIGFGHQYWFMPRIVKITTGTNAAHNDFIRLSAEIGYLGMVIFYLCLFFVVLRCWWRDEGNLLPWIGFVGFMAMSLSDNVLSSPSQYILLVLGSFANSRDWGNQSALDARNAGWRMTQFDGKVNAATS